MSLLAKDFQVDEIVIIGNTASDLYGSRGQILGCNVRHLTDFYIVLLDKPYQGQRAVVLPEGNLSRMREEER